MQRKRDDKEICKVIIYFLMSIVTLLCVLGNVLPYETVAVMQEDMKREMYEISKTVSTTYEDVFCELNESLLTGITLSSIRVENQTSPITKTKQNPVGDYSFERCELKRYITELKIDVKDGMRFLLPESITESSKYVTAEDENFSFTYTEMISVEEGEAVIYIDAGLRLLADTVRSQGILRYEDSIYRSTTVQNSTVCLINASVPFYAKPNWSIDTVDVGLIFDTNVNDMVCISVQSDVRNNPPNRSIAKVPQYSCFSHFLMKSILC